MSRRAVDRCSGRLILSEVSPVPVAVVLRCPRDDVETLLKPVKGPKGRFELDVCPRCYGAWFDKGEISKISGDREIERMIVEYAGGDSGLVCPRCGRGMVCRPVGDVKLDVCGKCKGVWVDSGELAKAARTLGGEFSDVEGLETPGLARAILNAGIAFAPLSAMGNLIRAPTKRRYPPDVL